MADSPLFSTEVCQEILVAEADARAGEALAGTLHYAYGRQAEQRYGNLRAATSAYQRAVDSDATLRPAWHALAELNYAHGDSAAAATCLDGELAAAGRPDQRCGILLDRAIHALAEGDLLNAERDAEHAHRESRNDPATLELLSELYWRGGRFAELEGLTQELLEKADAAPLRSVLWTKLGALAEHRLGEPKRALRCYQRAAEEDQRNIVAQLSGLRLARASTDARLPATWCERLATQLSEPAASAVRVEAAQWYQVAQDPEAARRLLAQVSESDLRDIGVLTVAADRARAMRQWGNWIPLSGRVSVTTQCERLRERLALEIAQVLVHELDRPAEAAAFLERALTANPASPIIPMLLGRLYDETGQPEALAALLTREVDAAPSPRTKATAAFRLGTVYERKLGDLRQACRAYGVAYSSLPTFRAAASALGRMLSALNETEALIGLYEQELVQDRDTDQQIRRLRSIARLWEHGEKQPDAAADALRRILLLDNLDRRAASDLRRILDAQGKVPELVALFHQLADKTEERFQKVEWLVAAAEAEERLGDQENARATWTDVLRLLPHHQLAHIALGRLLARSGDFAALVAHHLAEAEQSESPSHKAWLLGKAGRVCVEQLDDFDRGAKALERAMGLAVDPAPWVDLLEDLALRTNDPLSRFERLSALPPSQDAERMAIRQRAMGMALIAGGRPGLAAELLRTAETNGSRSAAIAYERLLFELGDFQALDERWRTNVRGPAAKEMPLRRVALLLGTGMRRDQALELLDEQVHADPHGAMCLLPSLFIRAGAADWRGVSRMLAASEPVWISQTATYVERALLADLTAPKRPLPAGLLSIDDPLALIELGDFLELSVRETRNFAVMERILGAHVATADTDLSRSVALVGLSALQASCGEIEKALGGCEEALGLWPGNLAALRLEASLAARADRMERVAAAREREADLLSEPLERRRALLAAADAWQDLGHTDAAVRTLRAAMEFSEDEGAFVQLVDRLRAADAAEELVELYQKRLSQLSGSESADARERLWIDALDVAIEGELVAQAADLSAKALADFPASRSLLQGRCAACRLAKDPRGEVEATERLLQLAGDDPRIGALRLVAARLLQDDIGDHTAARSHLELVLERDAANSEALRRVVRACVAGGDFEAAVRRLEKLVHQSPPDQVLDDMTLLAELHVRRLQQPAEAANIARRILSQVPHHLKGTILLTEALEALAQHELYEAHLKQSCAQFRRLIERDAFAEQGYRGLLHVAQRRRDADMRFLAHAALCQTEHAALADRAGYREGVARLRTLPAKPVGSKDLAVILEGLPGLLAQLIEAANPALSAPQNELTGDPINAKTHPQMAALYRGVADTLNVRGVRAHLVQGNGILLSADGRRLLVGADALGAVGSAAFRCSLVRELARSRTGQQATVGHAPERMQQLLDALVAAANDTSATDLSTTGMGMIERLSRKPRQRVQELAAALRLESTPHRQWNDWVEHGLDRVALAVVGDPAAVIEVIRNHGGHAWREQQLLAYSQGESILALRQKLGNALRG